MKMRSSSAWCARSSCNDACPAPRRVSRAVAVAAWVVAFGLANAPAAAQEQGSVAHDATSRTGEAVPAAAAAQGPEPVLQDPEAELARGETMLRLGRLDEAVRAFSRVIRVRPDHLPAHERLRRALIEARKPDQLPDILAALARLHHRGGDRELAGQRLDELIALAPAHPARHGLEQQLGRLGRPAKMDRLHLEARLRSLLGVAVLLAIAWLLSNNRKRINLRVVGWGLCLQLVFATLILWTPPGRWLFDVARQGVDKILSFTDAGASFLFGSIYEGLAPGATRGPVQALDGTTGDPINLGLIFAFHILPTIVFFGSLMSVFYHYGIIQRVVRSIAWLMSRTMGTSGAESLSTAANIFVGQTEAPLLIKPYVAKMTNSELMAVMCGGFATVAGGVLAAYVRFGFDAGHLMAASVMSAPASLMVAKILYPETEVSESSGGAVVSPKPTTANVIDAAAAGATDGLKLAANVAAMLLAFIALVALANWLLSFAGLSLKAIFGYAFFPLSFCMGVDTADLLAFGNLLGTKISINEFVAYVDLANMRNQISERTFIVATYALCGFANFASIAVQIGGISSIAPERRGDLARLGLKAMFGGAIASWLTACIAGVLL